MAVSLPPIDEESWQDHNKEAADRADAQARADLERAGRLQEEQEARRQADRNLVAAQQWEAATAPHREAARAGVARDLFGQATAPLRAASPPGGGGETSAGAVSPGLTGRSGDDRYRTAARGAFGDLGEDVVENMARIGELESTGNASARYVTPKEDSRGFWQINTLAHPQLATKYDLNDPAQNALAAREVYDRQGYGAWYNSSKRLGLDTTPGAPATRPRPAPAAPAMPEYRAPVRAEAVGQFEQGLPYDEAASICGPVAALAFAQANGRNPDLGEARRLAARVGWTAQGGMNGVANEQRLLEGMGVASRLDTSPDFGEIAADAASGNPVIVSTGRHYYYVNGYDPATGRLRVGKTGEARRGGSAWMSAQQIAELDGGINGVLYVDNPRSPAPSVAVATSPEAQKAVGPTGPASQGGPYGVGAGTDDWRANQGRFVQAVNQPPAGPDVGPPTAAPDVLGLRVREGGEAGAPVGMGAPAGADAGPYPGSLPPSALAPPVGGSLEPAPPTRRERVRSALESLTDALIDDEPEPGRSVGGSWASEPVRAVGGSWADAGPLVEGDRPPSEFEPPSRFAPPPEPGLLEQGVALARARAEEQPAMRDLARRRARGDPTLTPEEIARVDDWMGDLAQIGAPLVTVARAGAQALMPATAKIAAQEVAQSALGRPIRAAEEAVGGAVRPVVAAAGDVLGRGVGAVRRFAADEAGEVRLPGGVRRFFHGTGSAFDRPEAAYFNGSDSHGPAYYMTPSSEAASEYAVRRAAEREGAANVRAIDVPEDLRLLNDRDPLPDDVVEAIRARFGEDVADRASTMRTERAYDYLRGVVAGTDDIAVKYGDAPGRALNRMLADLGYDGFSYGIVHAGGARTPALAVFPESLPKLRNAVSGTSGGIVAPDVLGAIGRLRAPPAANVAGAVAGGVAGYETTPEGATPLETALHVGAGALAGSAGVNAARGALRGALAASRAPVRRTVQDFLAGGPGTYVGYRGGRPGATGTEMIGGTYVAQSPRYARSFADWEPGGVVQRVEVDVARPFPLQEGDNALRLAQAEVAAAKRPPAEADGLARLYREQGMSHLTPWARRWLGDQGYDAVVSAQDLGGAGLSGPVLIALDPAAVRFVPEGAARPPAPSVRDTVAGALRGGVRGALRGLGLDTGISRRLGVAAGEGERAGETAAGREVERLRLDKFPEAVRDTIQQAAERGDFWLRQRRNVIPDAEAERMADELGRTVEQMVSGGRAGRAYNTEETRALRNALTGQAIRVDDLRTTLEELGERADPVLRRTLGEEEARLLALSRVVEGARAEAGRAFRAYLADTRGRLARSRVPQYTNLSRVPIEAAPELEGRVVQPGFEGPPEHRLGMGAPGPAAPELGPGARQATAFDPLEYYRGPRAPGPRAPPAPPSAVPRVTEQPPLITERVATTGRATNLLGQTTTVGAGRMSLYDKASLVRLAGMLSGVPTHLLNIAANTVQGVGTLALKEGQVAADIARVGVGRALGRDVRRERFQAEVGPQIAGYGRGLWAGLQQVPAILRGDLPQDFLRAMDARRLASGSAVLDTAVEAPLRALAASDAVFRSASFGGHAAALATRKATQEGLSRAARTRRAQEILGNLSDHPDILNNANNLAARDVFQEARLETDAIARFKRSHPGVRVAADVVLPFYRTPYNVAAQGAGMTPVGYLSALAAARRGETGEAVDRAVRATVGTLAVGLGLHLAANNLLTGAYPDTEAERSTLPEGWKPYSLRVPSGDGAVYVPVQAFGAAAVPLGVAAIVTDAQRRGARKDDLLTSVYAGLGGIGQFMGDMSALQGLNSVMKLATEPERSFERTAESYAASLVPGSAFVRQVQQAFGDAQRDPDNPVQAFMAGIPGLSQFVPEKLTSLGEARARGPSGWRALLTGGRVGVERDEPTLAAYREAGASLSPPGESVLGHAITPAEQRRVQTRAGELLRERVGTWQTDPEFRALTADERKDILDRARTRAREDAGVEVLDPLSDDELARRRAQYALKRPA